MGTVFKLAFYAPNKETADLASKTVFDRIDTLNAHLSDYIPDSELNRLCAKAGTAEKTPVSADLWKILKISVRYSAQSEGAFDVTVGALTRLWRRSRNLKELPDSAMLSNTLKTVGYQKIHFYKKKKQISLEQKGVQLDLGGIAQGYTADDCLGILRTFGIKSALVDAGGDIALGDAPPGEEGWSIEIPTTNADKKNLLTLKNCGITTSGATYRYLEIDGKRYSHIVDPKTGVGLTHRILVTVQAPNATQADAWATAISVMGEKGWSKISKKHPKIKVWLTETGL